MQLKYKIIGDFEDMQWTTRKSSKGLGKYVDGLAIAGWMLAGVLVIAYAAMYLYILKF